MACSKDDHPKVGEDTANFIPQVGKTYSYRQELEEGEHIVFTRSISGSKDSTGFKVYNLRTRMVYDDIAIEVNNGMYVNGSKTVQVQHQPEQWGYLLKLLERSFESQGMDVEIKSHTAQGFPVYSEWDNKQEEGALLRFIGPQKQSLSVSYEGTTAGQPVDLGLTVSMEQQNGRVVAVEEITVPAGKFKCSKYEYKVRNGLEIKVDGVSFGNTEEEATVQVWLAHGVGVVKEISVTNGDVSTYELTEIK
ncbi:hypothetical protein [Olivibacter sitiensis]|uniref:TapB family protein n=1 Tax=Olivibacter sitiensis TaxID=376470 RepID=UPI0012F8FA1B|nr:hypothetical protein [Olivibacter sitiensis]